jgi:protein phosphatase
MIPVAQAHLHVSAATHPGRKGKNNEDRYGVSAYILSEERPVPALLAIVADGIGGHRAGEIAAEMAVEGISQFVASTTETQPVEMLRLAFEAASQAIYARAVSDPSLQGMGTTCACCWILDQRLYMASVGDSRIYLARGGKIYQLTTDHTWIQEAIDLGAITPDQAVGHPNLHVIRRFLGSRDLPQTDTRLRLEINETTLESQANQGLKLEPGDQVLLCTDGLTDLVQAEEIRHLLESYPRQEALDKLIELANQRGGHDNITLVLLEAPFKSELRNSNRKRFAAVLLVVTVLAGMYLLGDWLLKRDNRPLVQPGTPQFTPSEQAMPTLPLANSSLEPSPKTLETGTALPHPTASPTVTEKLGPGEEPPPGPTRSLATLTPWPTNTP